MKFKRADAADVFLEKPDLDV